MRSKAIKYIVIFLALALQSAAVRGQQPQSPEEREREMRKNIDATVERMIENFNLEEWQAFYIDSILTHDYGRMADELQQMQASKVENPDLYIAAQDKWQERIYEATRKVLNDAQWQKYLKYGAAKDKKARDKRAEKRKAPAK